LRKRSGGSPENEVIWSAIVRHGIGWLWLVAVACGGGSDTPGGKLPLAPAPIIELAPVGETWSSAPVEDGLDELSNNGLGYTGEIDRYEIAVPSDGRLQVTLEWEQDADLDLIISSDEEGIGRLKESINQGFDPEFLKLDVTAGQKIWIFVVGWQGEAGDYTLNTLLLPPELPVFRFELGPPDGATLARNQPFALSCSEELDPGMDPGQMVFFVGFARNAGGSWCVDGRNLVYFPSLPKSPDDPRTLRPGDDYRLQFPDGPRGPRSIHGEFLDEVVDLKLRFEGWQDLQPDGPPRVLSLSPDPTSEPWEGGPITVTVSGALDPATLGGLLRVQGFPVATYLSLEQEYDCEGVVRARIELRTNTAIAAGSRVDLDLPGTIRRLGGSSGLTGAEPAPPGDGFHSVYIHR
jgi:hypothetical protein